jgi:hypothetical protein
MNGQRDIERVLEHWLLDGSNAMPQRLFDAVLDRVERVPQRRLARLNLRWTEMNPRIRLYTLAAAGLAVALVGLYLFGRMSPNVNVGSSPSPAAATPSAPASTAMPAALEGVWIGSPRELEGLDADAGRILTFSSDGGFHMRQSANGGTNRIRSAVIGIGTDRVSFTADPADADCQDGDLGTYTWSVSSDGQTLTLAADGTDACPVRAAAVAGSWELVDCPTADDNCLGTIAAGTHASQFFDPNIGPGDTWTPRYAAITYTVPDGWINEQDWPDFYRLQPAASEVEASIFFVRDVVLSSRADHCSGDADPDAETTPEAIATALAVPGLTTSTPEAVTIGGLAGYSMDIGLDAALATACPFSSGRPHHELFTDRDTAEGFSFGIEGDLHQRVYLLEIEPGRTTLVVVEATETGFDAFVNEAATVVDSLAFNP